MTELRLSVGATLTPKGWVARVYIVRGGSRSVTGGVVWESTETYLDANEAEAVALGNVRTFYSAALNIVEEGEQ